MDVLSYSYNDEFQNRLMSVSDLPVHTNRYQSDFDGMSTYTYDEIGNLLTEVHNNETNTIDWDVYNKVNSVTTSEGMTSYTYDSSGNRVTENTTSGTEIQIRDAQGNALAIYQHDGTNLSQREVFLYGSSRLGKVNTNILITDDDTAPINTTNFYAREYELSNHLGNVLSTFTGRKLGVEENNTIAHYSPEILSATDYFPFGQSNEGRSYRNDLLSSDYRFGFNGKEKDENGEFGSLTHYDYGFRIYNPSIAKFLSVDPLTSKYSGWSPYNYVLNNPIRLIDVDGREPSDFIYLLNKFAPGSGGFAFNLSGHSAVLIGDDITGWTLYNKTGANDEDGNANFEANASGEFPQFATLQDFYDSRSDSYQHGIRVTTDAETDRKMKAEALRDLPSPYSVELNNCADFNRCVADAGELNLNEVRQKFGDITWPKDEFNSFLESTEGVSLRFYSSTEKISDVESYFKKLLSDNGKTEMSTLSNGLILFLEDEVGVYGDIIREGGQFNVGEDGTLNRINDEK